MESTQEHCIFCKIITGDIPATKIFEDEKTFVFLDIKPINPGHMLVIPKEHYINIFDLPAETAANMMETAQKMAGAIKQSLGTENVNVYMNNGPHSGQVVFHSHIHVIPRYENDGYGLWHGKEYASETEKSELAQKLIANLH